MSKEFLINVGPIGSFNSLVYYLGPQFQMIRESYIRGETPLIILDFRNVRYKAISIAALTGFISATKKLRDFVGYPLPILANWDPDLQGFLSDIGFYEIVNRFKIFEWRPSTIIGGYKKGSTNPNTKLLYYADISPIPEGLTLEQVSELKAELKQKIAPNYLMRCSNIFRGFDEKLEDIISNTSLELIVNSLTHAEEIAFVGIQRTSNRITISVCDSGVGFPKSLKKLFKDIDIKRPLTHQDGILIGSLIQKSQHGLRLAISEVLNYDTDHLNELNEGWVIISSFNSEIRWQKNNWDKATNYFEKINISKELPSIQIALGEKSDKYIEKEDLEKGYWKSYDNFLLGTRISFEIKIRE